MAHASRPPEQKGRLKGMTGRDTKQTRRELKGAFPDLHFEHYGCITLTILLLIGKSLFFYIFY